ncbi:MAG: bifunctional 2-polyprenyl-6-hydroxyphenol methylase/3-demethylubiquinol 3-O-methyltransferase UbiG [Pseudomonadota bacterium]
MSSIDPREIEKFDHLSQTWWDPNGESRALHDINRCRGEYVAECDLSKLNILDVGCGGGLLSEYLASKGARVVGIDASAEIINVAREHAKTSRLDIEYHVATIEQFSAQHPDKFDVVTCMEMLEHVPEPAEVIEAISASLKPDAYAYFSTLNRTGKAYALGVIGAEYIMRLLPVGTHDYEKFIKPSELARWCRAAELDTIERRGIYYNPLSRVASLSDDLSINYIVKTQRRCNDV